MRDFLIQTVGRKTHPYSLLHTLWWPPTLRSLGEVNLLFACLPLLSPVAAVFHCQHRLKITSSPGILQDSSARLRLLRHPACQSTQVNRLYFNSNTRVRNQNLEVIMPKIEESKHLIIYLTEDIQCYHTKILKHHQEKF